MVTSSHFVESCGVKVHPRCFLFGRCSDTSMSSPSSQTTKLLKAKKIEVFQKIGWMPLSFSKVHKNIWMFWIWRSSPLLRLLARGLQRIDSDEWWYTRAWESSPLIPCTRCTRINGRYRRVSHAFIHRIISDGTRADTFCCFWLMDYRINSRALVMIYETISFAASGSWITGQSSFGNIFADIFCCFSRMDYRINSRALVIYAPISSAASGAWITGAQQSSLVIIIYSRQYLLLFLADELQGINSPAWGDDIRVHIFCCFCCPIVCMRSSLILMLVHIL